MAQHQGRLKPLRIAAIGVFAAIATAALIATRAATPATNVEAESGGLAAGASVITHAGASSGSAIQFAAGGAGCEAVSDKLVPACGIWLGAWSKDHGVSGFRNQIEEHESRIGRQVHIAHTYKQSGDTLSNDEKYFVNRANTYLFANWKPANSWATADGGNASVNASIDAMADSILSVSPKKLILTVHHEPENDVTGGADGCASNIYNGSIGTPTEYRNMWINVQNRFAAKGVTNVVWAMTYMGFSKWDCMLDDLWPGDDRVDWLIWEPYYGTNEQFAAATAITYNKFASLSAPGNNYLSKPWGFGEWASWHPSTNPPQPVVYQLYDDARTSLNANTFPNLKMLIYYDTVGPAHDDRLEYTHSGVPDPTEQQHYNDFANSPIFDHHN